MLKHDQRTPPEEQVLRNLYSPTTVLGIRMSTNSLFLPHEVMHQKALGKCYRYVTHNFMSKKKGNRRHSLKSRSKLEPGVLSYT